MTKTTIFGTVLIGSSLVLSGCSSWRDSDGIYEETYTRPVQEEVHVVANPDARTSSSYSQSGVQTAGFYEDTHIQGKSNATPFDVMHTQNVFYFDFDKSTVSSKSYDALQIHSEYLMINPEKKIHIIGHADERGTPEYNLALGELRAKAIFDVLTLQGVDPKQVVVTSYGEESPIALGHDEASWAQNRRAEIVY